MLLSPPHICKTIIALSFLPRRLLQIRRSSSLYQTFSIMTSSLILTRPLFWQSLLRMNLVFIIKLSHKLSHGGLDTHCLLFLTFAGRKTNYLASCSWIGSQNHRCCSMFIYVFIMFKLISLSCSLSTHTHN